MPMRWMAVAALLLTTFSAALAEDHEATLPTTPVLENLMRATLEGVGGTEVIVSRVVIPPHTELPRHWHPGEEFAYVVQGTVTLWQDGAEDTVMHVGDVGKVPLHQVHTAITGDEGCELIVFRVHAAGEPERVLLEEQR